jgi:SAM-dependent methyltransferase
MQDAWDRTSAEYQTRHQIPTSSAHYGPWVPSENELRLLGDVSGRRILELGCGGGQCSIAFAKQGATAVGIDLSENQLAFARDLAKREGVEVAFYQSTAADLKRFAPASFDVVFSAYALLYVPDVTTCLAEVHRVLLTDGQFVFSLDHPFRDCFWDEELDEDTLVPTRSYFQRGAMDWQFSTGGEWMRSYHHTIGDWVSMLRANKLHLEAILEPAPVLSPEEESTWSESYALEVAKLVPQTIIFVARKG